MQCHLLCIAKDYLDLGVEGVGEKWEAAVAHPCCLTLCQCPVLEQ